MRPHLPSMLPMIPAILLAAGLLAGCAHEYECWCPWPPDDRGGLDVRYDWSLNTVWETPEGMSLLLYPEDGRDCWMFGFGPQGGYADAPHNLYDAVSYNSDTENAVIRGLESPSTLEAYTLPARLTDGLSEAYSGPQPPSRDDDVQVCRQPDMIWLSGSSDVDIPASGTPATLTLTPQPIVCRYTILIDGITNLTSASGMSVSLSGLAPGYMLGLGHRADGTATMPGSISTASATSIAGRMLTFGPAMTRQENTLCLYVWLRDGSKREYRWDVTDQIDHPADGHSLTIHISGLTLPEASGPKPPSGSGGGMNVDVDSWETVDIELST